MKKGIFSSLARAPRRYRFVLLAILFALALATVAVSPKVYAVASAPGMSARSAATTSTSTPGLQDQDPSKLPGVKMKLITLSADRCAALKKAHPEESCQLLYYWRSANHQPIPAGAHRGSSALSSTLGVNHQLIPGGAHRGSSALSTLDLPPGWWYWSGDAWVCSIYGCWFWELHLTIDGVANGSSVWQWNEGCTPSGLNTSVTWCGYLYNGGGWPNYGMQFGLNGQSCTVQIGSVGAGCVDHGLRQWVDDWGNFTTFYSW